MGSPDVLPRAQAALPRPFPHQHFTACTPISPQIRGTTHWGGGTLNPGAVAAGRAGAQGLDAEGQTRDGDPTPASLAKPCRADLMLGREGTPGHGAARRRGAACKRAALPPAQSPRASQERGVQIPPAPLGVYFGQTACRGVMLRLNLDTKNDYFLEQLLGNPQPSTWLQTLPSASCSLAWIERSCRSTQSQTPAVGLNLKQGTA